MKLLPLCVFGCLWYLIIFTRTFFSLILLLPKDTHFNLQIGILWMGVVTTLFFFMLKYRKNS